MCIAKILGEWKTSHPDLFPNNTEVVIVAVIAIIAIIGVVLYLNIQRYEFIGQTIGKGNLAETALLMTPELTGTIASILGMKHA